MSLNYYRSDGWVKAVQGQAISGAQIYVCTQPANVTPPVTPPRTQPVPWQGPNPQALIYSDAGVTPIVQPIITDGFGHYDFYTLPGIYTVVVMFNGQVQQVYVDQSIGNVSTSGSGNGLSLETNSTPNVNQALLNLIEGAGIAIVTDNLGNTTITSTNPTPATPLSLKVNNTPNASQSTLNLTDSGTVAWTDNGGGSVSASVQSITGFLPTPDQKYFRLWTTQYGNVGSGGGTTVWDLMGDNIASTDGGVTDSTTAPSSTAGASHTFSANNLQARSYCGNLFAIAGRTTTFKAIYTTNYDNIGAAGQQSFGLCDAQADPVTSGNFVGFLVTKTAASEFGNWFMYATVGGTPTTHDTGIVATHGTRMKFVLTIVGSLVSCTINGVSGGSFSPSLPTAGLGLNFRIKSTSGNGNSNSATVEYLYAENATP